MKRVDAGSLLVIGLTLILFLLALFSKGLTHDLLLEAGVFLVSVKLIIAAYQARVSNEQLNKRLDEVSAALNRIEVGVALIEAPIHHSPQACSASL